MPDTTGPAYVLDRTPPTPVVAPELDPSQRVVVDHPGGPLLVLAGPGTGKTTTLVEAVVARVERGLRPDEVLVLTFSRKAAEELRERITARLGRTVREPSAWTFHGFCYALTSAYADGPAPRLLSGPERLVRIRELLAGSAAGEGRVRWPEALGPALLTRGMARELADLLDRARERDVDPERLRALAAEAGRDDWRSAAAFYEEYVDVLGSAGEIDYGELVRRTLLVLDNPSVLDDLRRRYRAVFVDEYQDTDPAQERLLHLLAGDGGDLVVVGDPDQSIYAFRGADVRCILGFPDRFRRADGSPAPTVALDVSRRAGTTLLACSREIAKRITAPGLAVDTIRAHRALAPATGVANGDVTVRLFATVADEATAIADVLRRAHLEAGMSWRQMAVLVRSGKRSIPVLRRTLVAAGVPVTVAADEIPIAADPAVAPLLLALRCAADPSRLDEDAVRALLTSPLVRATPAQLRRLGRALRAADRDRLVADDPAGLALPRASATLVRDAVATPGGLVLVGRSDDDPDARAARPAERLATLLRSAKAVLDRGEGAESALWDLWNGSGWPGRLLRASAAGGRSGRAADRDLDAVVALFEELARLEERRPRAGVNALVDELEAQEIPSEHRREGTLGTGAVRLLTAHRSKGLEWDLVVVAGVQDGVWPDVRRRSSLLAGDRVSRDGVADPPSAAQLLVDERRLFYVAVTRARRQLVVTAVRSLDDDGDRPSRFIDELGVDVPARNERPAALLSPASLVARLRHITLDPEESESRRRDAATELARLAAPGPDGTPWVAAAHPTAWWGLVEWTGGAAPIRPTDKPVALSGSAVKAYDTCPLAWFLEREAKAARPSSAAQGFGLVLHVLARLVATGALPAETDVLLERLDKVWNSLAFDADWQRDRERGEAQAALERFLTWHRTRPEREWVASEAGFEVPYADTVLRGSIDRVERGDDGRVHVCDLKTSGSAPGSDKVAHDAQLGVYQIAVREGGLAKELGDDVVLGGAELVQLRQPRKGGLPQVQPQLALQEDADPDWADVLVRRTAAGIVAEAFPARVNERCDRCAFARACPARDEGTEIVR